METKETTSGFAVRTSNQQPFDKRLIAHIVSLAEQGVPRKALVEQFGMSLCTLCDWLKKYGTTKVRKDYTVSEKRSVVRAVASGMSIKQAVVAFSISSGSIIRKWIADFKEENAEIGLSKPLDMAKKKADHPERAAFEALEKELAEAKLKIRALDTLIDIAEEQLKINIRKKSGARQS